jgi:hypothetical protein
LSPVNAGESREGIPEADSPRRCARSVDAPISAKIALIGIDRSLDALATMALEDDDARLELLRGQLRRALKEVEARFPGARAVVREGLDSSG